MTTLRPGHYRNERSDLLKRWYRDYRCPNCLNYFGGWVRHRRGTKRGVVVTTRCVHCQHESDYVPQTNAGR